MHLSTLVETWLGLLLQSNFDLEKYHKEIPEQKSACASLGKPQLLIQYAVLQTTTSWAFIHIRAIVGIKNKISC